MVAKHYAPHVSSKSDFRITNSNLLKKNDCSDQAAAAEEAEFRSSQIGKGPRLASAKAGSSSSEARKIGGQIVLRMAHR